MMLGNVLVSPAFRQSRGHMLSRSFPQTWYRAVLPREFVCASFLQTTRYYCYSELKQCTNTPGTLMCRDSNHLGGRRGLRVLTNGARQPVASASCATRECTEFQGKEKLFSGWEVLKGRQDIWAAPRGGGSSPGGGRRLSQGPWVSGIN